MEFVLLSTHLSYPFSLTRISGPIHPSCEIQYYWIPLIVVLIQSASSKLSLECPTSYSSIPPHYIPQGQQISCGGGCGCYRVHIWLDVAGGIPRRDNSGVSFLDFCWPLYASFTFSR